MVKNLKKLCVILIIMIGSIIVLPKNIANAVLQANGSEGAQYSVIDWMKNVRKMEELGGAMGLSETINDDLTTNGASNNIDVHMQKNTEYGALAILSASSYGNPNKIEDGDTTTGNATGAVMKLNSEWVSAAAGYQQFMSVKSRYIHLQTAQYIKHKGDAIIETKGWHGSTDNAWGCDFQSNYDSGVIRAIAGGIFSYRSYGNRFGDVSQFNQLHYTRAVVVSGEGV